MASLLLRRAIFNGCRIRVQRFCTQKATSSAQADAKPDLVISDSCVHKLKEIVEEKQHLRVLVDGGGCSGFEYKFTLDSVVHPDDRVFTRDGVSVVVDQLSLDLMLGATVDYQDELIKAAFRISHNPLAEKGCSCGASFALK